MLLTILPTKLMKIVSEAETTLLLTWLGLPAKILVIIIQQ
jgi:hypothetical protein